MIGCLSSPRPAGGTKGVRITTLRALASKLWRFSRPRKEMEDDLALYARLAIRWLS